MALSLADLLDAEIMQVTLRIAEVTASAQPDYSEAGRTVSAGAYLEQLSRHRAALIEQRQKLNGPYMVVSRVRA